MNVGWIVELTDDKRATLRQFTCGGSTKARNIKRALILLAADNGMSDAEIAANVGVGTSTVYRVKRAFVEEGFENALEHHPQERYVLLRHQHADEISVHSISRYLLVLPTLFQSWSRPSPRIQPFRLTSPPNCSPFGRTSSISCAMAPVILAFVKQPKITCNRSCARSFSICLRTCRTKTVFGPG
jgi:hypothetical protein